MASLKRNFSMKAYWKKITEDWEPLLKFKGKTKSDWTSWRNKAYPKFMELLGEFPKKVPLEAEVESSKEHISFIHEHNHNYGEQMARAGFLTISPDLRVFGERRDGLDPFPGRDPCNVNFVKGTLLGIYTLTLNIWDMKCCLDYLETRPEVDKKRIGMMGLSQGGTMTTFTAAAEPRINAADIIGYVNPWREFGIKRANFCGSQIVPGIYRYFCKFA